MPIIPDIPLAEAAVIAQTNAFRVTSALPAVVGQPTLTKTARAYAGFLAASTVFSHEADGRRPIDRIKAAGYKPCATAENLAWMLDSRGFETVDLATKLVEGWKASPPHRKNLMMAGATETGVAIVKARREEKYFAVQLFGRPASLQFTFEIENRSGKEVVYAVGGEDLRIASATLMRHTLCEPAEVAFQVKPGGLLAKAVTARYPAKGGQVFKLGPAKAGEIKVTVEQR